MTGPIWLLTVTYGGRRLTASSRPVEALDRDGAAVIYRGGLESVEVARGIALGGDDWLGESEVTATARLTPSAAVLTAAGWRPDSLRAELALLDDGDRYDARRIVARGRVGLDVVAGADLPATLRLLPDDVSGGRAFPAATARYTAGVTRASLVADLEGKPYPWVFGSPGAYVGTDGTAATAPASPAHYATTGYVDIAGHAVAASTVTLYSVPEDLSDTFAVETTTDLLGRTYSRCDVSGKLGTWTLGADADIWVTDWGEGGLVGPTGARWTVTELARYLLSEQGARIDHAALSALRHRLDRVRLDAAWVEAATPWEWLAAQWAPLDPALWWVSGPRGLAPVVLDEGPSALAPLLRVGRDLHRPDQQATVTSGDGAGGVVTAEVLYGLDREGGDLLATAQVVARRTSSLDAASAPSGCARRAAARGGVDAVEVEAAAVYDRAQAWASARSIVAQRWSAPVTDLLWAPLRGPPLRLGQLVRVLDEARAPAVRPAWVTGVTLLLDRAEYALSYRV